MAEALVRRPGLRRATIDINAISLYAAGMKTIKYPGRNLSDIVEFLRGSVGREIRARRKASGISQSALARKARVRVETVSRIENGYPNPTFGTIHRLLIAIDRLGA